MHSVVSSHVRRIHAKCSYIQSVHQITLISVYSTTPASAMATDVQGMKKQLRKEIKEKLRLLTTDQMSDESVRISAQVLALPSYLHAKIFGLYLHCAKLREVDTSTILEDAMQLGKKCYVPAVEDSNSNMKFLHLDDLSCLKRVRPFDILEPPDTYSDGSPREDVLHSCNGLDMMIIPGLGFDRTGRRLGRGGGYYDKMISQLQRRAQESGRQPPLLVALSYEAQLVDAVPVDEHDQRVDLLVTATDVVACTARAAEMLVE